MVIDCKYFHFLKISGLFAKCHCVLSTKGSSMSSEVNNSFLKSTNLFREREIKFKSCKVQFWSVMLSNYSFF